MRLLLINPNTNQNITGALMREASKHRSAGTIITARTVSFGTDYIGSAATLAIASHAVVQLYRDTRPDCDVILLGCFGDPGLAALQEMARCPVIGLIDASLAVANLAGERIGIITGGMQWRTLLPPMIERTRLGQKPVAIRCLTMTGPQIAADHDRACRAIAAMAQELVHDAAVDVIILGGAVMAGLAPRVRPAVVVPVIDCLHAGIAVCEAVGHTIGAAARHDDVTPQQAQDDA